MSKKCTLSYIFGSTALATSMFLFSASDLQANLPQMDSTDLSETQTAFVPIGSEFSSDFQMEDFHNIENSSDQTQSVSNKKISAADQQSIKDLSVIFADNEQDDLSTYISTPDTSVNSAEGSAKKVRVLSLDGGGVRGIGTLAMLAELEVKTGKKTYEMFDRIYGTSTGGLMAVLLASGKSATEVLDIYVNNMGRIFNRTWADAFKDPFALSKAQYSPEGLEKLIEELLPGQKLKDVKVAVAVTTVDAGTGSVVMLSSEEEETKDVSLIEAGRATSAAPTYFPQKEVHLKSRTFMGMDGGVIVNNPAYEAYRHTLDMFADDNIHISMLSLGTGAEDMVQLDKNAGLLGFGSPANIPAFFMGLQAKGIDDKMDRLNAKGKISHTRVQFYLPFAIDLADTSVPSTDLLIKNAWERTKEQDFVEYLKNHRQNVPVVKFSQNVAAAPAA